MVAGACPVQTDKCDRLQPHAPTDAVSPDEGGTAGQCHDEHSEVHETPPARCLSAAGETQSVIR